MDTKTKKKPGRPMKNPQVEPIDVNGISDAPRDKENVIELVYSNTSVFKRIMSIHKQARMSEVVFVFDVDRVEISLQDAMKQVLIHMVLDGQRMNSYYCDKQRVICVTAASMNEVLTAANNNSIIHIRQREADPNGLNILIEDPLCQKNDRFMLKLCQAKITPTPEDIEEKLRFTLPTAQFKRAVCDISKIADENKLSVEFIETERRLQLSGTLATGQNWVAVYNNCEKIALVVNCKEGDILLYKVNASHIRPFAGCFVNPIDLHISEKTFKFVTTLSGKDNVPVCTITMVVSAVL